MPHIGRSCLKSMSHTESWRIGYKHDRREEQATNELSLASSRMPDLGPVEIFHPLVVERLSEVSRLRLWALAERLVLDARLPR